MLSKARRSHSSKLPINTGSILHSTTILGHNTSLNTTKLNILLHSTIALTASYVINNNYSGSYRMIILLLLRRVLLVHILLIQINKSSSRTTLINNRTINSKSVIGVSSK